MELRKTPKRLLVDIPEQMHKELKAAVALRGITLKKFVLRAIKAMLDQQPQ